MSSEKKAWDPNTNGYGKHDYRHIDPATINPDDYARSLRGEEEHFGDVREYNSAANNKHPENDCGLDWLGRIGTVFETDLPGHEGTWMVVKMPIIQSPKTFCRVARIDAEGEPLEETLTTISCIELGCAVDETNHFKQVQTKLIRKGKVDRTQRERLTKR